MVIIKKSQVTLLTSCKFGRIWRNWQTRTVQVRVLVNDVEVRILLSAPKIEGTAKVSFFVITKVKKEQFIHF